MVCLDRSDARAKKRRVPTDEGSIEEEKPYGACEQRARGKKSNLYMKLFTGEIGASLRKFRSFRLISFSISSSRYIMESMYLAALEYTKI